MKLPDFGHLPVRFTLPLLIMLGVLSTIAASLYLSDMQFRQEMVERTAAHAVQDAARFSRMAETAGQDSQKIEREIMLHEVEQDGATLTALVDPEGRMVFSSRSDWRQHPVAEIMPDWDEARFQRVTRGATADLRWDAPMRRLSVLMPYAHPPAPGEIASRTRGAVLLEYDISDMLAVAERGNLMMRLGSAGAVLVLSVLLMVWLDRRMTRPLTELARAAQRIGAGDLRGEVRVRGAGEVVALGRALADMARQLDASRTDLENERAFLRLLLDSLPDMVWLKNAEGRFLACNARFERLYGVKEAELVGKTDFDFVDAEKAYFFTRYDKLAVEHGVSTNHEELEFADGHVELAETIKTPMFSGGKLVGVLGIAHDITPLHEARQAAEQMLERARAEIVERQRSEQILAIQSDILHLVAEDRPLAESMGALARAIEAQCPGLLASILLLDDDGVHLRHCAAPSLPPAYCAAIDGTAIGEGVGSCGTAAWRRQQVIVEDVATDPLWADFRQLAAAHGLAACWSTPIPGSDGELLGTFAIYHAEPCRPDAQQLRLIERVVQVVALAIERHRAMEQLHVYAGYQGAILDNIPYLVWLKDEQSRFIAVNRPFASACGRASPAEVIGKSDYDIWPGDLAEAYRADDREVLASGMPKSRQELVAAQQEGRRWFETYKSPVRLNERTIGTVGFARDITERMEADAQIRKLSMAVEQSPESILITDLDHRIEYVNAAFVANYGYAREQAMGRNPRFLGSGRTPRETYAAMRDSLALGQSWQGEFFNRGRDGSERIMRVTVAPIRDESGSVTHYLSVQQDVTEKKKTDEAMHRLAYFDTLTDLPNRAQLIERLGLALAAPAEPHATHTLLLVDIDRFKTFNNARGHAQGDRLLRALALRLAANPPAAMMAARLGADQFAMLMHGPDGSPEEAASRTRAVAEELRASLHRPFGIDGDEVSVTVSLGATLLEGGTRETPIDVLRRADMALHRAKDAGGDQVVFFEAGMLEAFNQRFQIERDLRKGIAGGELRLFLQPQVNAGGVMTGAEALVRWQHPEKGMVPPGTFVPVAEETDLIIELDQWVLTEVCRLMARLDAAGQPLRLAVNISPRHFGKPGFVAWVRRTLAEHGADPGRLTLEITEGLVIGNVNDVIAKMDELAALGVHFAVDDFGTGYSSLSYLKRLPIHELKIDKTFVQDAPDDPDDAALVEVILAIAGHLQLRVVAEGVETAEQAAFLDARGKVIYQGYFFGRPEPAEAVLARCLGASLA